MKIAVISNKTVDNAERIIHQVVSLLTEWGATVLLPENEASFLSKEAEDCVAACDAVVALGGDGTMIHIAKCAAIHEKPVLGINCGHLGFMTDIESDELHLLKALLDGNYEVEERMMLDVSVNGGKPQLALNELAISRASLKPLMSIHIENEGESVLHYQADGVLVSTPTGSTAYSLSAGGPVIDPSVKCLLVTPVCPHSLAARSYIFDENVSLTLTVPNTETDGAFYILDGSTGGNLCKTDSVTVKKSDISARFINIKSRAFYEVLRQKLIDRAAR